ncbi:MAG TPA: SRPBCC family protein [Gammaproteobacteria bacterium]
MRPRPRSASVLLLALLGGAAAAAEVDLGWIERAPLEAGEILVDAGRDPGSSRVRVKVAALMDAPPKAIFDVLTACEIAPEYVPNVVSCRLLETLDGGKAELFVQVVKPAFFLPRFEHVFRLDYEGYETIGVHRVSGPIAYLEGMWRLLPEPSGKTLVVYDLEVDPGMPVPRFWVRATMKRDLPRIVEAVRVRAERAAAAEAAGP